MAWFQVSFGSSKLKRQVNANVLIPADDRMGLVPRGDKQYKTLYLLHGYSGDYTDWLTNTSLMEMAMMNDIAIVMPSGENSFYLDIERSGRMYSEFIGQELVDFTRRVFPLSRKREDTIIGGLSMGGYGALYNGLKHNDVFAHVIALSSALIVDTAPSSTYEPNMMGIHRGYFEEVFGDLDTLMESDKNLEVLAKQVLDKGKNLPDLYIACGWNDNLCYGNRKFSKYLNDIGFKHIYEEGAGTHEWPFWNNFLKRGLARLELAPKMPPMTPPFWTDAESDSPNPVTP
ncbi:MAG: esterase family protein [Oscillospiraceae bacterium]|nr:esterase family protein [Oscillospiraceae bacterium]